MLAFGGLVLAIAARYSARLTLVVIIVPVVFAAASFPFVLTGAHDTATGLLLVLMHSLTAAVYVVIGRYARESGRVSPST